MTLQGKDNTNETMEVRASATRPDTENTSADQAPSHEEIRLGPMESIWNVAGSRAMSLMIGCKPNANSSVPAPPKHSD
jgi:hypothetical protein